MVYKYPCSLGTPAERPYLFYLVEYYMNIFLDTIFSQNDAWISNDTLENVETSSFYSLLWFIAIRTVKIIAVCTI